MKFLCATFRVTRVIVSYHSVKHAILRSPSTILVSHRHSNTTVRNPNESPPIHYVSHPSLLHSIPTVTTFSLVQNKSVILCTYSLKEKGNATRSNLPSSYRFPSCLPAYARALTSLLHLPTSLATSAAAQV